MLKILKILLKGERKGYQIAGHDKGNGKIKILKKRIYSI